VVSPTKAVPRNWKWWRRRRRMHATEHKEMQWWWGWRSTCNFLKGIHSLKVDNSW
jgi:hypothetical protein